MFVHKFFIIVLSVSATVASPSGPIETFKLNDGHEMPRLGLGTWLGYISTTRIGKSEEVENAVMWAIDAGYRHIDTAAIYNNEDEVGSAINKKIAEGVVKREDLFVTTKLWNNAHSRNSVLPAIQNSLKRLNLDYVDMYLIHWPVAEYANQTLSNVDYLETWEAMIALPKYGLAKSIGVSNFNKAMLERLISKSQVKPANLQVEINLNLQQPELLKYCKQQNIVVTGYTPFGSMFPKRAKPDAPPPKIDDPKLLEIARKYKKTVPQIVLRYLVELNVVPIPKTITKSRLEENINIFDFSLTQEERDLLKNYDVNYRSIVPKMWEQSPYYPFERD